MRIINMSEIEAPCNSVLKNRMLDIKNTFPDVDFTGKSILFVDSAILNYGVEQDCSITLYDKNNYEVGNPVKIKSRRNMPNKNYARAVACNKRKMCQYGVPFILTQEELKNLSHVIVSWGAADSFCLSTAEIYTFLFAYKEPVPPMFILIESREMPSEFFDYIKQDPKLENFIHCDNNCLRKWIDEFSTYIPYTPSAEDTVEIQIRPRDIPADIAGLSRDVTKEMLDCDISRRLHECNVMSAQEDNAACQGGFIFEKDVVFLKKENEMVF